MNIYNKAVCSKCAGESLGRYINLNGDKEICDYCEKDENPVIQIETLLPVMYKSWELYFSNFDDSSFHEEFRTPYYLSDIVDDEDVELTDANETFLSDLKKLSEDRVWQKDSEYWTSFPDALISSWERFCKIVKNQWRYTYFLCGNDFFDPATYSPLETMDGICDLIKVCKELICELKENTSIFRARKDRKEFKVNAKELGSAPEKYAQSNRFSPKGISMFYGSLDDKTCFTEAIGDGDYSVIAEFHNSKPIRVLDLTNIPSLPKLYDDNFRYIPALKFLHFFSQEISKDADNNDLNYIPTQVFTEYIRFKGLKDFNIKGLKYCSAKCQKGENLVLFYKNEDCKDSDDGTDCLIFYKKLDETSLKLRKANRIHPSRPTRKTRHPR